MRRPGLRVITGRIRPPMYRSATNEGSDPPFELDPCEARVFVLRFSDFPPRLLAGAKFIESIRRNLPSSACYELPTRAF
jgi:hypothetical protein